MPTLAFTAILFLSLALHLAWALQHNGYLGVDGGQYLLSRNQVLGDEPTGEGFPRPVLAPGYLLVPFTSLFGDDAGYKAWSAVAALIPLAGAYLLVRRLLTSPWAPTFIAGLLAVDLLHAEMFVTGALPLVAFGLIALCMRAILTLHDRWSWPAALTLPLALGLIAHINQTAAGLTLIYLPVFTLALFFFSRRLPIRVLLPGVVGVAVAATALPWYLALAPNSGVQHYPGPWIYPATDSAWFQVAIGLAVGMLVTRLAQDPRIRALGVLTSVIALLTPWLSYDESLINIFYRSRYALAIPWYICTAWLLWTYIIPRLTPRVSLPATAAVAILLLAGSVWQMERQASYSDQITPATARILQDLRDQGDTQGIVTNAFSMSLWVAALNKVPSPNTWTTEPPRNYTDEYTRVRCILGWIPGCDVATAASALGVSHVLIDTRFPYYNKRAPAIYLAPADPWAVTARAPRLVLEQAISTSRLYRIGS